MPSEDPTVVGGFLRMRPVFLRGILEEEFARTGGESARRCRHTEVLSVLDIRKRFGEVQALDGCSFSVARGRMLGFLGPNVAVTSHRTPEPSDSPGS